MLLKETLTRTHFVAETLQPALKHNATDNCFLFVCFKCESDKMWMWRKSLGSLVPVCGEGLLCNWDQWCIGPRPSLLLSSKWKCPQISVIVLIHTLWSKVLQFKSTFRSCAFEHLTTSECQVWLVPLSSHGTQQLGKVRYAFFSQNKDERAVDELLEID